MKVLLTGASGFVGGNIAAALIAAGHQIVPVSRRDGYDFNRLLQPGDWLGSLHGVDAVINGVGIIGEARGQSFANLHTKAPTALFQACVESGIRRVVQISALGADATAFSAYHLSKRAADDALRDMDLDWLVLRPSLIYGRGGASTTYFMRIAALPLIPVMDHGRQIIQPVHISDVVACVLACLTTPQPRQTIDVVGPETLSFSDWFQAMRQAQGLPPARLVSVPFGLAMAGAAVGRYLSLLLQPENLRMLQAGSQADGQAMAAILGRPPLAWRSELFFADGLLRTKAS